MAESTGEKTEAATPRKREKAREQGNIARSQDLSAAILLIAVLFLLNWFGGGMLHAMTDVLRHMLGETAMHDLSTDSLARNAFHAFGTVFVAMIPLLVGLVVVAVLANVLQVGWFFSFTRLKPKADVLNPMKGIKKLMGDARKAFQLAMNITKLILVGVVAYTAVHGRLEEILSSVQLDFITIFALGSDIVFQIGLRVGILLLLLAIIDFMYQRWKQESDLRMSKQEVKDEMKMMDGDPRIKQRRRQIQLQQAMRRVRSDVPQADVVVTNPTHFAVALKYDAGEMHAPRVVAKGGDLMAFRIREIAVANGVPILERRELARALYYTVEVGQEIPEQFYATVAEILAYVYELTNNQRLQPAG